ncbi:hypothetical protein PPL_06059 [Heterostelium album PN500]|nr:hypothetical protein PPL_06059 [Heterostelium album PN500]EFA81220.1 hypothetical protein PPL_06059 [Heterostelium album PN500]|eukprot:XP_020433338.1 hypothetical protein PPL_06059 [Heterostelium album PN500]
MSNFVVSSFDGKPIYDVEEYGLTIKPQPFLLKLDKRI